MMNKILIGLFSAAAGAAVSWFLTKRHYEKKMDNLVASTNDEVGAMHQQLSELHRIFVTTQPTTVAMERQKQWDDIAKNAGSTVGATYKPRTDEEIVQEFREGIKAAKQEANKPLSEEFARYSEKAQTYVPDEIENDSPTIYEITAEEYFHGDPGYAKQELALYMLEEDVYDVDSSERIDGLKGFIGMTSEELMERIDIYYDDDTDADKYDKDHLYFRNENVSMDFEVQVHREGNSPYYETML